MSIPGMCIHGWPCNIAPMCLKDFNSSSGKKPLCANTEYNAGAVCPLDSTNLSLSSISGFLGSTCILAKYRYVSKSEIEREPPGCPDFAL